MTSPSARPLPLTLPSPPEYGEDGRNTFRIPGRVFVRRGRVTRPIVVQLHSSESATVQITLLRKSGRTLRLQRRAFRAHVSKGTSRMTLPRSLWRMTPGSYRLRIQATDVLEPRASVAWGVIVLAAVVIYAVGARGARDRATPPLAAPLGM